jgi:hypothetical protein
MSENIYFYHSISKKNKFSKLTPEMQVSFVNEAQQRQNKMAAKPFENRTKKSG